MCETWCNSFLASAALLLLLPTHVSTCKRQPFKPIPCCLSCHPHLSPAGLLLPHAAQHAQRGLDHRCAGAEEPHRWVWRALLQAPLQPFMAVAPQCWKIWPAFVELFPGTNSAHPSHTPLPPGPALAPIFADPGVVKVLHGSDSDVVWLQVCRLTPCAGWGWGRHNRAGMRSATLACLVPLHTTTPGVNSQLLISCQSLEQHCRPAAAPVLLSSAPAARLWHLHRQPV